VIWTKVTLAAISYEVLDELLFSNLQLTLVNGDICHIQLSSSNSSLHDFSCCWLLVQWLFLVILCLSLLRRLITPSGQSRLLSTSCGPGLSATSGRSKLGAATDSFKSAVDSIQHRFELFFVLQDYFIYAKYTTLLIVGLKGGAIPSGSSR